jgi:fatty-acyl-CoA synthase/cyclohexanecarboxylate-CoA ligase/acyl-CoA synthetase
VAVYKLPEMLEVFEDFPFTPTGKVQRRILAMRVLERRGAISHAGGGQPSV